MNITFDTPQPRNPAEMCAQIAHQFLTVGGRFDSQETSALLRAYTLDALIDECIDEWGLSPEWMQAHALTRSDISHAFEHFADARPDMVFSDEELREAERDYQDELKADDRRERNASPVRARYVQPVFNAQ